MLVDQAPNWIGRSIGTCLAPRLSLVDHERTFSTHVPIHTYHDLHMLIQTRPALPRSQIRGSPYSLYSVFDDGLWFRHAHWPDLGIGRCWNLESYYKEILSSWQQKKQTDISQRNVFDIDPFVGYHRWQANKQHRDHAPSPWLSKTILIETPFPIAAFCWVSFLLCLCNSRLPLCLPSSDRHG